MKGVQSIGSVIGDANIKGMIPKSDPIEKPAEMTGKKIPALRLFARFLIADPYHKFSWDGPWLQNFFKKTEGICFNTQWEAIQFKIDEINSRCSLIIVYDNRVDAIRSTAFRIKNGTIISNNIATAQQYKINDHWSLKLNVKALKRV